MGLFSSLAGSILRGGILKNLGKGAIKGLKGSAGKLVKGVKRQGVNIVRKGKKAIAQVKELPSAISRGKQLSGAFKNMPLKTRISNVAKVINNQLEKAGKSALSKDAGERLAKSLGQVVKKAKVNKTLNTLLRNARKNESWRGWLGRNASKLGGDSKALIQRVAREAGENIAVDRGLGLGAKVALGVGGTAVSGAVSGAVIASQKK
jgi:hypothetical protein